MRRIAIAICAWALLAASCTDEPVFSPPDPTSAAATTEASAGGSSTVPTTVAPTTTAAPGTTAAPATTAAPPPTAPAPTYATATHGFFPDPLGTPADGHGSGCIHDPGALSDGMWFGFVEAIGGGSVTFDMGCFFTGPAAVAAAADDGAEAFDFYTRNMNPVTYSVPLDASGTAYWLDATGDLTPLAIAMTSWPMTAPPSYQTCPDDFCSVWLFVNGGVATELVEQYLP